MEAWFFGRKLLELVSWLWSQKKLTLLYYNQSIEIFSAHVAELIEKNESYSLGEYSENSQEAMIKRYRYVTANLARQTTFLENSEDCLKVLYAQALHKIRRFEKSTTVKKIEDNEEARTISSFFITRKWSQPALTHHYY